MANIDNAFANRAANDTVVSDYTLDPNKTYSFTAGRTIAESINVPGPKTTINMADSAIVIANGIQVTGSTVNLNGSSLEKAAQSIVRDLPDNSMKLDSTTINVASGKFGIVSAPTIEMNNSTINVNGTLELLSGISEDSAGEIGENFATEGSQGVLNLNGSALNIGRGGTLNLHPHMDIKTDTAATFNNQGTLKAAGNAWVDLRNVKLGATANSHFIASADPNILINSYDRGVITFGEDQFAEARKGSLIIEGGRISVDGDITLSNSDFSNGESGVGKIAFTNGRLGIFRATTLTLKGQELNDSGTVQANTLNLENNFINTNTDLGISATQSQSALNIGNGKGTLNSAGFINVFGTYNPDVEEPDRNVKINGNINLSDYSQLRIYGEQGSDGHIYLPDVEINGSISNGILSIQGATVTLASGTKDRPNTITIQDGKALDLRTDDTKGQLNLNQPNTALIAEQNVNLYNNMVINASVESFGLSAKGDQWSSKNLQSKFFGPGQIMLSGTGNSMSKQGFSNLRELLGATQLGVDASIKGAVTDGKTALADVAPGALLAGAVLPGAIVTGAGEADMNNFALGSFGGINLTNSAATGITVQPGNEAGSYAHLSLLGNNPLTSNNGNLVNTTSGAGNILVKGGYLTLADGKIGNVEISSGDSNNYGGYVTLNNVQGKEVKLTSEREMAGNSAAHTLHINGNVSLDKISTEGNTWFSYDNEGDFNAVGEVNIYEDASLRVSGDIGTADQRVGVIRIKGDLTANSINVVNFVAYKGEISVNKEILAYQMQNNGANISTGVDLNLDDISIDNGGETASTKGSVTGNTLNINSGTLKAQNNITILNDSTMAQAAVSAQTGNINLGGNVSLSGENTITAGKSISLQNGLDVKSGSHSFTANNGDINLNGDTAISENAELNLKAANGAINVDTLSASSVEAKQLAANGDVSIAEGSLALSGDAKSSVAGKLNLQNAKARINGMDINGDFAASGGEISAKEINLQNNASFNNGVKATIDSLNMQAAKNLIVGGAGDSRGGTVLSISKLMLNGSDILVDPAWNLPSSNLAVGSFTSNASANDTINDTLVDGNIVVGRNSYVAFGTENTNWLPNIVTGSMGLTGLSQSGPSAVLGLYKPMVLAQGKSLTVDGGWTHGQAYKGSGDASITFAPGSLLVVNARPANSSISYSGESKPAGTSAALSAESATKAEVGAGAKLYLAGAEEGKTYVILDPEKIDTTYADDTAWGGDNLGSDNPLIAIERTSDLLPGEVRASARAATVAFPNLDSELGEIVDGAMADGKIGTTDRFTSTGTRGRQFLSRALIQASPLYGNDPDAASANIESAARMITLGGAPQMLLAANQAAGAAVSQRTSLANPNSSLMAVDANGNLGMEDLGLALWVMPLYQSTNGFGMEAGNYDYDFSGTLGGVALGADYTFENALRAGIFFNIGGGYMRGSGDLNTTTNNMNFWGVGAYAGWSMNNFGLTADIAYTSTYNKIRQDIYGMGDFDQLKIDTPAWAISTGLKAEYKIVTDYLDIMPHVGFRFINLNVESYSVKSRGNVLSGDSMTQNIWTFPIGVTLSKDLNLENGWNIKPLLDLNITPATGDIKAKSNVHFSGFSTEAELKTKMMDYVTYGGTAGIEVSKDNFSFGVNYSGQFGAESSAHGVFATFRYEF